jgi:hypothetical protein
MGGPLTVCATDPVPSVFPAVRRAMDWLLVPARPEPSYRRSVATLRAKYGDGGGGSTSDPDAGTLPGDA